ncbi:MAG: LytTR family transcriptional regulator DNA-binding domain-containing protein [Clostridia bacterium]|nr:LytTR family transcriptional regulator DNA-binding domain-containing protein [Clostridia bacterium]
MKLKITIDRNHEEEILLFAHERTKLVDNIESLVKNFSREIIGYTETQTYILHFSNITCFIVENNKVYAITDKEKLQIKMRLYQLEEMLSDSFVKINQSCIANINEIKRFDSSISGTLKVVFKNGYGDYVSRRNIKAIKERLGVK